MSNSSSPQTTSSRPPLPASLQNTQPAPILQYQGAEALLYRTVFLGTAAAAAAHISSESSSSSSRSTSPPSLPAALKHRPPKPWRHPTLDAKLIRHRILQEARILVRLRREGLPVPALYALDWEAGWFIMEWIDGCTVRAVLDIMLADWLAGGGVEAGPLWELMSRLGTVIGKMHEVGIVHGDLTTSNLMLQKHKRTHTLTHTQMSSATSSAEPNGTAATATTGQEEGAEKSSKGVAREEEEARRKRVMDLVTEEVVLIDFGLAAQSVQEEDRAVDLYVLEKAFGSTHPKTEKLFRELLRAYGQSYKSAKTVVKRFEDVRMRGRKRIMIG